MKPILDPKRDLVLEMSTLLCKPLSHHHEAAGKSLKSNVSFRVRLLYQ